ncbi:unnamed protein product, partial [Strongylus vulgaris]
EVNPTWSDEKLFQEARRIVIAQIQHITYNEFVPIIVGKDNLRRYSLDLQTNGYDSRYDMKIDSSTLNVFASVVGQFFLALFPDHISLTDSFGNHKRDEPLGKVFNEPSFIYQRNRFDAVLRFLTQTPIMKPGLHLTPELKNAFKKGFELSLRSAILIEHYETIWAWHRHGRLSYPNGQRPWYSQLLAVEAILQSGQCSVLVTDLLDFFEFEKMKNAGRYSDTTDLRINAHKYSMSAGCHTRYLLQFLPSINASLLEQFYESPEDVDLIVGGLAETPSRGALLGPTLSCLFAEQMQKTKRGDRFWYENFFYPSSFSTTQLEEIRKTTLARVICDNADDIRYIQHNAFNLQDDYGNCPVSCNSPIIDSINFSVWKDEEPKRALPITKATVEKAIRLGIEQYNRLQESEGRNIRAQGPPPSSSSQSAVFSHASLMAPKRESLDIARVAGVLREATKVLVHG